MPDPPPKISLVIADDGDELTLVGTLPSLAATYQEEVEPGTYEVIVVAGPEREASIRSALHGLRVAAECVPSTDGRATWLALGAARGRGDRVALIDVPGVASPTLLAALFAATDAHPNAALVIPTFDADFGDGPMGAQLALAGWPANRSALVHHVTLDYFGPPRHRWLDAIARPDNVVLDREQIERACAQQSRLVPAELVRATGAKRVQIVGDGMVRRAQGENARNPPSYTGGDVDPAVEYFGRVQFPPQRSVERPTSFVRTQTCTFSIVAMTYNMRREAPRTLRSLLPPYQRGVSGSDCEMFVVDNGSSAPLSEAEIRAVAPGASFHVLESPPPTPAHALNYGAARTSNDILLLQSDGASILSPGVLAQAAIAFRCFPRAVVITQYFYLGPGRQIDTILQGYDKEEEDRLLARIDWPSDGYRLFEVSSPQTLNVADGAWLGGWFESDCILVPREVFDEIGGFDERFNLPGGGLAVFDFLHRAWALPDVQPVKLIGEGVFHQVHGGITTNTTPDEHELEMVRYKEQYEMLRGPIPHGLEKGFYFLGSLKNAAARAKMKG